MDYTEISYVMAGFELLPSDAKDEFTLRVAGKLTIASPIPDNEISCYNNGTTFPTGGPCTAVAFTAPGLGYRSLDFLRYLGLRQLLRQVGGEHRDLGFLGISQVVAACADDARLPAGRCHPWADLVRQ